jgi:hypothetical protein
VAEKKTPDAVLALELFAGRMVRTKTGRRKLEYLSGLPEHQAKIALARVMDSWQPEDSDVRFIKLALTTALIAGADRKLVFQSGRGRPSNSRVDARIDRYVTAKMRNGCPVEAAVAYAMKEFGLSRKAIFAARRRQRESERESEALQQWAEQWLARGRGSVSFNQD